MVGCQEATDILNGVDTRIMKELMIGQKVEKKRGPCTH